MPDCPASPDLRAYAEQPPAARQADGVRRHLDRCPLCRLRVEGLERISLAIRERGRSSAALPRPESLWHPVRVAPPVRIGGLTLHKVLQRGDHSVTFEGHERTLNRTVSVRFLLTRDTTVLNDLRTTADLAGVRIPGLNPLHFVDVVEDFPMIVSDLCPGLPLADLHLGPALSIGTRLQLVRTIATLLAGLHERGHLHNRLGPTSVLADAGGYLRLADHALPPSPLPTHAAEAPGYARLAPPEAAERKPTPASDVYALAGLAYEIWTGHPPFTGSFAEIRAAHDTELPATEPLTRAGLPVPLQAVLLAGLAKDPAQRPTDGAAFADAWQRAAVAGGLPANPGAGTRVPDLAEAVMAVRPNRVALPRAGKVRAADVPDLLSLLARRHGLWGRIDPAAQPDWLDRVYPELTRFPARQRPHVLAEVLEDDRSAESAAGFGALLGPVAMIPLASAALPLLPGLLGPVVLIGGTVTAAWLGAGVSRMGYALLTHRTLRIKLRRRLLAGGTPICLRCAYDLRGNQTALCPECGYLAPLIQFRVLLRGEDERGRYAIAAYTNSLNPGTAGACAHQALCDQGYQVREILDVRQEPGWSADWPIGLLRVGEKARD